MTFSYQEIIQFFSERKIIGIKPGLERMHTLLKLIGNPERKIRAIHVAGTNGKGSTIHYIRDSLIANGYQTGVFTSPSLTGLEGHIYANGQPVSKAEFTQLFHRVYPAIQQMDSDMPPTEFEILTAMAFLYFAENSDIAIIESGMGGRFDTTNVITPIISIITNIELDHRSFLGNTIKEIAFHKAGIIKKQVPMIVGEVKGEALQVIKEEAATKGAPVYQLHSDFSYEKINGDGCIEWFNEEGKKVCLCIAMAGEHQLKNVAVAWTAIEWLMNIYQYPLDERKAIEALKQTVIPGRFEIFRQKPLVILDVAHNPAGIRALIQTLKKYDGLRKHVLFSAFKDKDYEQMITLLEDYFSEITVTTFDHPRALSKEDISKLANNRNITVLENWKEGLSFRQKSDVYVVTGSFAFIENVRNYLLSSK